MIDGIISLAGFHVTNTFRKNRNSGEYEFIITTLCSVAFNKQDSKQLTKTHEYPKHSDFVFSKHSSPDRFFALISFATIGKPFSRSHSSTLVCMYAFRSLCPDVMQTWMRWKIADMMAESSVEWASAYWRIGRR